VWSAVSERWPDSLAIIELVAEPPHEPGEGGRRFVLDLGRWPGWPRAAVVTLLPAALPGTYANFELRGFVGQGGMGQVGAAGPPDSPDMPLAVKLFTHPSYLEHPLLLEQCLREARVGIGIDSPHVARTYQMLDLRGQPAGCWPPLGLVMPLYEPTLERVL